MLETPNCYKRKCKYFRGVKNSEPTQVNVCDAYPNGIPNDIAYGIYKHLEVREDQENKIIYEMKENA